MELTSGIEETMELTSGIEETIELTSGIIGGERYAIFNGTSAYIEIADNDLFTFSDGSDDDPFTVSFWIKADSFVNQPFLYKGSSPGSDSEWGIYTSGVGILYFFLTDISQMPGKQVGIGRQVWNGGAGISGHAGSWINIICRYAGTALLGGIDIFVNGSAVDDNNASVNLPDYTAMQNTSNVVHIGFNDKITIYGNYKMRDLRIYNKGLLLSEVADIVAGNPLETNLIAHYKLQNDARDYGSNGISGTNNNVTFSSATLLELESSLL